MTTKLKELLEKRKSERNNVQTIPEGVQVESNAGTTTILIPEWVLEDEFSEYF